MSSHASWHGSVLLPVLVATAMVACASNDRKTVAAEAGSATAEEGGAEEAPAEDGAADTPGDTAKDDASPGVDTDAAGFLDDAGQKLEDGGDGATTDADAPQNPVAASEQDTAVRGADQDQNGVRDDLQTFVTTTLARTDEERALLVSYAREETKLLVLGADPSTPRQAFVEQALRSMSVHHCIYAAIDRSRRKELLIQTRSALLNNEARWRAFIAAEHALGGSMLRNMPCDAALVRP